LEDFSIEADREEGHPGVWINEEEIAAIGLSLRRWVSMHGFALNITVNLEHFSFINPCGFANRRATSMSKILGSYVPMEEATHSLISHFYEVFGFS
jgi:lipoyl(octanoyl) transferase